MKRRVRWLLQELPDLVEQGVINQQAARRIHDHYMPHLDGVGIGMRLLVILGALLIGLGVILLIAHNWPQWSRSVRTVVSFSPLIVGQMLVAWTLLRRPHSASWREGSGTFLFISIGACIGLIEQTYHLGTNDYAGFLLTWMLLGIPLVYLLDASVPLLLYWAGIVGFAWVAQNQWGQALLFWPLWLAGLPHVVQSLRRAPWDFRSQCLSWATCLAVLAGTAATLERAAPGLWLPIFATLFAGIYLTHYRWLRGAPDVLRSPFQIIGVAGVIGLSLMFTFANAWDEIASDHTRSSWHYREFAGMFDYVVLATLLVWWFGLLRRVLRRRDHMQFMYAGLPLVVIPLYLLAAPDTPQVFLILPMNLYAFVLGIATLRDGMRNGHTVSLNVGLLVICSLLLLRFFDSELPFTIRGVAFVVIGTGFLATNLWLRRRLEA